MRHFPGTADEKPAGPHAAHRLRKEPLSLPMKTKVPQLTPDGPARGPPGRPDTCAGSCRWSPGRPGPTPGSPRARRPQTAALPPWNTRPRPRSGPRAGPAGAGAVPPVGGQCRQAGDEPGVLTWAAEKQGCADPGNRFPWCHCQAWVLRVGLLRREETQTNSTSPSTPFRSELMGTWTSTSEICTPACRGFYASSHPFACVSR